MSKKNPPPQDSGFGELEDDFFNSGIGGWGEPNEEEEKKRRAEEERKAAEAQRAAAEADARRAEEARKAEEARLADEARAAEEARKAEEARAADAARAAADADARAAEEARLAAEAEARRAEEARQAAELARAAEEEAIRKAEEESRKAARRKALQANPTIVADFEELRRQAMAELARDDSQETESQLQITPVDPGPPPPVPVTAAPVPPPPEVPPAPVTATMVPDDDAPPPPPVAPEAEAAAEEPPPEVIDEQAVEPMADVPAAPVVTGDGWAASVELLRREAVAAGDPAARVALLTEAAALARVHGPGAEAARALLDAAGVGKKKVAATPAYWRERAATHAALGDLDGARAAFQSLGAALSGAEAADAWVAASDLARRAGKDAQGFDDLRKAVEACADDVRALFVLLDALRVRGDSTVQVFALERLASLHVGSAAAALHAERARLLEKDRRRAEEAHDAWIDALTADAGHSGAFLALERAFRKAGEWDALTSLYKAEGDRLAGAADVPEATRGVEAAWWYARAARVARTQLFNGNLAGSCYALALAASPDDVELRNEYEAWCGDAEKWPELAQSLSERVERAAPEAKSFLQYRLARVTEERLGDVANALGLYRAAAADPAAAPAAEAVLRLLQQRGDHAELVKFLEQRLGTLADPSLKVTVLYRMGETCEGPLDDQKAARKHYEAILDFAPGYLPALEGLERVYSRQQAWADLAAVYEQRALLTDDPHGIALHRQRAGSVYDIRLGNGDKAREQYRLALEAVPDFPPSLDAYTRQLEALGDWASLARVLRTAANATRDANEAVSLVYRAGRVLADRTDDMAGAMACLERCLELSPGFLPAILLLKELAARAGNQAEYFRLERAQADMGEDLDRRHWRLLAAAEAAWKLSDADPAQLANEVLREDAHQPAALDLASRLAIAANDTTRLVELLQKAAAASRDDVERARICARIAELSADQEQGAVALAGVAEVIGATGATKRPLRTLARLAESLGSGEEALRALEAAGASESVEAARLRAESGDGDGAVRTLSALLAKSPEPAAAAALLRSAGGEPSERARAHLTLAEAAVSPAVKGRHALLAAPLFAAAGLAEEARRAWESAFDVEPRAGLAFEGLRALLIGARDADGLRTLYGRLPEDDAARVGLGDALEAAGDLSGAVHAWRDQLAKSPTPGLWSVRIEHVLEAMGEWKQVFELLQARLATAPAETKAETQARCRWLLAEKLAETEEAWEFYRKLHEADPHDVEVLEALARIAGARGETKLAAEFIARLSEHAKDPRDAARYQRRLAEVHERAGDTDAARAALTRALDVLPEDREALAGLRRLAEAANDWHGVVGVLAREAALSSGADRVARFAEIARVWEANLADRAVATDAWRKVLDLAPDDREALQRLVALTEEGADWPSFVEYAQLLLPHVEGTERASLLRRVGLAMADHLRREDDAIRFLDTASGGDTPDLLAARALERLYLGRGEWEKVVDAMLRRAHGSDDRAEKLEALTGAARIRLETLRDRAGAAGIYQELLAIDPDQPDALRYRADFLFDAAQFDEAVALFERLETTESARDVEDFDTQVEVSLYFFRFAEALKKLQRRADAIARYERALQLNPTHLPTLEAVGPIYMEADAWQKAEKVWQKLLQLTGGQGNNDQLARIYANLGAVEYRLGKTDMARKRFTKALELKPNDIGALRGYGQVLFSANDWNNLLNIFNNIIYHTQDPNDVIDAYLNKGYVLDAKLNLPDKAAQHYEKSLAFDPGQPVALLRLAELALRRQDWPEAASLAERGLQIQDESPSLRASLLLVRAVAYQACGDGRAAQEGYRSAVQTDETLSSALGGAAIEDYEKVHEALRARLQASQRI